MLFDQHEYNIRLEWGEAGVLLLAPASDVVIIVEVISFTTSVEIATGQGALVFPYRWRDESAYEFAESVAAEVADGKSSHGYRLSPSSLCALPPNLRLVLPSPNGSHLSSMTGEVPTIAGCLRNSKAVAEAALKMGSRIAVIPAGERWPDHSLRPCLEDLAGAGAIVSHLGGSISPEAKMAAAVFESLSSNLVGQIMDCSSGREKISRNEENDVRLACDLDVSACVPVLKGGAYVKQA